MMILGRPGGSKRADVGGMGGQFTKQNGEKWRKTLVPSTLVNSHVDLIGMPGSTLHVVASARLIDCV